MPPGRWRAPGSRVRRLRLPAGATVSRDRRDLQIPRKGSDPHCSRTRPPLTGWGASPAVALGPVRRRVAQLTPAQRGAFLERAALVYSIRMRYASVCSDPTDAAFGLDKARVVAA